MFERFAVYLTLAADTELYQLASKWLGHDYYQTPISSLECDQPALGPIDQNRAVTQKASQYGFHATLKPPFRLKQECNPQQLKFALHRIAQAHQPFISEMLSVEAIGSFLALRPAQTCAQLNQLSDHCVRAFEPYRAELTEDEVSRRQPELLTAQQNTYLRQWGYPYIFDEFRWHFTLTDALSNQQMSVYRPFLRNYFEPVCSQPLLVNQISLLHQPSPAAHFTVIETASLTEQYD